jgi:myo-inositol-1(or 4)-monophosphatase
LPKTNHSASADAGFLPAMSAIAREAGALLMRHFRQRVQIEYKGDVDLVTIADRESEALITGRIREQWPGHDILGEEGTNTNSGSDFRWYIDPLDGTTNFAHSYPVFCVSMGLEQHGELRAGVIYDPTRDELFAAERGRGATLDGAPIHASAQKRLGESLLSTGFPSHKRHKNPNIHFYHQITLRSHGVRRAGSAALDLANVASGRYDGFWELNLNPWDVAAGALIVTEAGGRITDLRGGPFDHRKPAETLASNGHIHQECIDEFTAIVEGRGLDPLPDPREYQKHR